MAELKDVEGVARSGFQFCLATFVGVAIVVPDIVEVRPTNVIHKGNHDDHRYYRTCRAR